MNSTAPVCLMVVDLVESVRLMQADEWGAVGRWRHWLATAQQQILEPWGLRHSASLGDGLLLVFDSAAPALPVAQGLHALAAGLSNGLGAELALCLRIGVHWASLPAGHCLQGLGVTRCMQLAAQAQPRSSLFSPEASAQLDPAARSLLRPAGRHALSAWPEPVELLELPPAADEGPSPPLDDIRPRLACVLDGLPADLPPGWNAVLLDDLVRVLSRCAHWRVSSSASSLTLAGSAESAEVLAETLKVDWLVRLRVSQSGGRLQLSLRLTRASNGEELLRDEWAVRPEGVLCEPERQASRFAREALRVLSRASQGFDTPAAMAQLDAYSLLMRAIANTHAATPDALLRAFQLLQHLGQRHPRASEVACWQALWHVFDQTSMRERVAGEAGDAERALDRALRLDEQHPLTLTALAHQELKIGLQLERAEQALQQSLQINPNEALTWLCQAHLLLRDSRPHEAVQALETAMALAPLEPARYFFDNFAAGVYTDAGQLERGLMHARRAFALNPLHLNSLARLIICEVHAGQVDAARAHAQLYLAQRPQARARRLLEGIPERTRAFVERQIEAYLVAGIPP